MVAISQGCLDWGLKKIGRSQNKWDRVFYHGYRSDPSLSVDLLASENPSGKKIFLFVGTFGESYELNLIAEVAKRFDMNPQNEIAFYIIGTGAQDATLKKKAAQLKNLHLPGWLGSDQIHSFLNSAWAGIVPCKSVQNAAPNKVFEYLSAGLPLISSLEGEIADLIEKYRIGLNYRVGDSEDLYQCINKLATNDQLRQQMSKAAHSVFQKYGDADRIYDDYADYIEKLVEKFAELA
jgi:glycosyltransferase involved in cell wall biosynthesis